MPALIERGFTGHEHLDKFNLINMNGRMYDPLLGRFLSPDPIIQSFDNSQSLNGYSYCINNPLKYTDPSGYSCEAILRDMEREAGNGIRATVFFNNNYPEAWASYVETMNRGDWMFAASMNAKGYTYEVNQYGIGKWVNTASKQNPFPSFATLEGNYPMPYSPGPYSQDLYYNQCAIRLSISLVKSGVDLSSTINYTNPGGQTLTSNGEVLGAYNLAISLKDNFLGKPEIYNGMTQDVPSLLDGRTGIIYFEGFIEDGERTDQARHIDLWNGSKINAPYYNQMMDSKTIWFWPIK